LINRFNPQCDVEVPMSVVPQFLTDALERVFFRPAAVSIVTHLSGHFRLIEFAGDSLKGEKWIPGQKVQFHLGGLKSRTYTPISWDPIEGTFQFLLFLHGNGPGSEWAESLKRDTPCNLMGPRSSLNFAEITNDSIFFGDETSMGAAVALHRSRQESQQDRYVFEVSSLVESAEALQRIGLPNAKIVKKAPDLSHLAEVEQTLIDTASGLAAPRWIMTGKAQSIQALRTMFRKRNMNLTQLDTKAYWAEGKTGLD
jgi:ferric-chelate reductase (NADPH)